MRLPTVTELEGSLLPSQRHHFEPLRRHTSSFALTSGFPQRLADGRCLVRISAGTSDIFTKGVRSFPHAHHAIVGTEPRLGQDRFLPDPLFTSFASVPCYAVEIHKCSANSATNFTDLSWLCSFSRTPQHFMESEGSLPCSQ
jgi:hypothetical protein